MRNMLVVILLLSSCAPSTVTPVTVPLSYKSVALAAEYPSAQSCANVARVEATDARSGQTIGTRSLQEKQSEMADVTSTGDVMVWLRAGAENALKQSAVAMRSDGPVLRVSLDNIKTQESIYRRAQYSGRVSLTTELVSPSGSSCWKGQVDGMSENYGYAGSPENYQETLNHALDRAMIRMLESPEFKKAICNCG